MVDSKRLIALALLVLFAGQAAAQHTISKYVPVEDGTRLAVDVHWASESDARTKKPTLIEFTRYTRSRENPGTGQRFPSLRPVHRAFLQSGYVVMVVDARGTGASFGTRSGEYAPDEVRDGYHVVEWVIRQPWSDGTIGAFGTSYSGTTAELLTAVHHPAVKAVIPGWSDFDSFVSPVRPYGVVASSFIKVWSDFVADLDLNRGKMMSGSVRRVDEDKDGSLLKAAVAGHEGNPNVFESVVAGEHRDQKLGHYTYDECSPMHYRDAISESGVPMLVFVSWLDAGTADGAIQRLQNFKNPQKVVIMATTHGGGNHASPFVVGSQRVPPIPTVEEQLKMRIDFFDHHLKGVDRGVDGWPRIRYYNLGEEAFRVTEEWPPAGCERRKWFFKTERELSEAPPASRKGSDEYKVDDSVTTGSNNRWTAQMGMPILNLDDRGAMDEKMLTYTSAPLGDDLQVTGTPSVTLQMRTDHADGVVLAYLEDVDESGRSRYLTEGGLRLVHRRLAENPLEEPGLPYHSFRVSDSSPVPVNEGIEVSFKLWPISVQIRKGHRVRVALAGADAGNFDRYLKRGTPTLTIERNSANLSFIELPVIGKESTTRQ